MSLIQKIALLIIITTFSCTKKNNVNINYRDKDSALSNYDVSYETGNWEHPEYGKAFESKGNHRVLIRTPKNSKGNYQVSIPWRRRDDNPYEKDIIIVDASTNTLISNKYIIELNNEYGHLIFQSNTKSGFTCSLVEEM